MAFNSFIRRVSASILCVGYKGAISPVLNIEDRSRSYILGRQFPPLLRFSTATGENLVREIVAYVDTPQPSDDVEAIPDGFPFEIAHSSSLVCLKRRYQDEVIDISVPLFEHDPSSFEMTGYIGKSRNQRMLFYMTAKPGSVVCTRLSTSKYFNTNMERFEQFLAIRGINLCTMKFLFDYCRTRASSPIAHLVEGIGDGLPFEIKDDGSELTLTRKYQDETIQVGVRVNKMKRGGDDIRDLVLRVRISCGDDSENSLEFSVTAFPDSPHKIVIDTMYANERCTGFQEAFKDYFEQRGINVSTTDFLFHFIQKLKAKLNTKKCFQGIDVESLKDLTYPLQYW
ncbi:uncharacterized protein [Euphorbia lathyris]|uniref:uncharacterized protein isoform X1 n=1 Tax=Euphorbia lathyris TaxID=212925 RepID=UPI00331380DD